jgi:hypothetical protein
MSERGGSEPPDLPDPNQVVGRIAAELGLNLKKRPRLFEGPPIKRLFPEEAPTFDGRYIAGACLEEIYNIVVRRTPPGAPIPLSKGDISWLHREFKEITQEAWDLPEPYPDFNLTHLLGAAKREIAHLSELKRFHESDVFDPTLHTYEQLHFIIEGAIRAGDVEEP